MDKDIEKLQNEVNEIANQIESILFLILLR